MPSDVRERISKAFSVMMDTLHRQKGANLKISIMTEPGVTGFIDEHAAALDGAIQMAEMTDAMRKRLQRSNWVFSGMKTFHELNEAFPSLLDENGNRKPFEQFLNDVQKIDRTYNGNYLRAEYNFVQASAEMAAKWERFMEDGDRYNLQYRTAKDDKVRPEHAELDGVTLPPSDPFWTEFYPPNGWNCRCTVVQVRKSKYPETPHDEAMERGEGALQRDTKGMFRFNPGIEQKTVPDYNPYTISRCKNCDIPQKMNLVFVPESEQCSGCKIVRALANADAKCTKIQAKPLQGTYISNPDFGREVKITGTSIKEWTNQPHKFFRLKNLMLLDIEDIFWNAEYYGLGGNPKNKIDVKESHLFRVFINGQASTVIVREYKNNSCVLHSISDGIIPFTPIEKK